MIQANAILFGDNIDTDQIIGAHHLILPSIDAMAGYLFEHYETFNQRFEPGDIIVAGNNFGCGSSREQAPAVMKKRGVAAVVALSFARIFYRNGINIGLRLIECPQALEIKATHKLVLTEKELYNKSTGVSYPIPPLAPFISQVIDHGGIIEYMRHAHEEGNEKLSTER